jgi:hypothetical protein
MNNLDTIKKDGKVKIEAHTKVMASHGPEQEAKFFLEQAGNVLRQSGSDYIGSFATHIYMNKYTNTVELLTQNQIGETPENVAQEALKRTMHSLMQGFGKTPPRDVNR